MGQQSKFENDGVANEDAAGTQKKPFSELVAEKLIEQLKAGTAPWQIPWQPGAPNAFLPMNPTTGKRYKGINALHLASQGRSDPRWMTYKQASEAGAQVRKGERGTPVQYWKFSEEQENLDQQGKPVKEKVVLERPRVFFATVFNAEQIDGLPPLTQQTRQAPTWDPLERADQILQSSGASITHVPGNRAFYHPMSDSIILPERSQFETPDRYYATALHELGHWTGHASRLNRDLAHPFGSEGYAKEELRAEIVSMILGDELGIGHDPSQHAAYVGSWVKALQDDHLEIFRAAAEAEKIQHFVLSLEQFQELAQEQTQEQTQEQDRFIELKPEQLQPSIDPTQEAHMQPANHPSEIQRLDNHVAESRQTGDLKRMDQASFEAFGFELPHDWNGRVQVQGNMLVEIDGEVHVEPAQAHGVEPEFWGVYAQLDSGLHQWLADFPSQDQAQDMAERLSIVDANSQNNVYQKAAKLARIKEERLQRDADSSAEDIALAKDARQTAEAHSLLAEQDQAGHIAKPAASVPAKVATESERTYLDVPFSEKDEAKSLGALWDRQQQSWFIPGNVEATAFAKWMRSDGPDAAPTKQGQSPQSSQTLEATDSGETVNERVYLAVPYSEREVAKSAGALWDKVAKSWYAGPQAEMERLQRWLPDNVPVQQGPALTPREEFGEALKLMGCVIGGAHPVMDGLKKRIAVEGDKKGEEGGFYVAHLDGRPAGYIKNNRTGLEIKWKSKGYVLDPEQKALLGAQAATKLAERLEAQEQTQQATAERVVQQMKTLIPIEQPTPYLKGKGIEAHAGVMTDQDGQTTYVPAFDAEGKQWTVQYITEDGTKRFAKDGKKEGCFHPVSGMEAVASAPVLVVAEGYSTAATLAQAMGQGTVAAFDSGNLEPVVKALHDKYPSKPVIVAGDDDRHLLMTLGTNPGRSKAQAAANAVGGKAVFPIFAFGENTYPPELPPITPTMFRAHEQAQHKLDAAEAGKVKLTKKETKQLKQSLLGSDQLAALDRMKSHTDFNDLAIQSTLGVDGLQRQVHAALGLVKKVEASQKSLRESTLKQEQAEKQQLKQSRRF